jgi:hypothetical protein
MWISAKAGWDGMLVCGSWLDYDKADLSVAVMMNHDSRVYCTRHKIVKC